MGWTAIYTEGNFKDVFEQEFKTSERSTLLAHSQRGNVNYSVWDYNTPEGIKRTAVVTLFEKKGMQVCYKDMDMSSAPYYYDMPKKLFDLLKAGNVHHSEYGDEWMAEVEKRLSAPAGNRLKVGSTFILKGYGPGWDEERVVVQDLKAHVFFIKGRSIKLKGFKQKDHVKEILQA